MPFYFVRVKKINVKVGIVPKKCHISNGASDCQPHSEEHITLNLKFL